MKVAEYRKLHGIGVKHSHPDSRSKRTKQSVLTLNSLDTFTNSECNFSLDSPILISHNGSEFYVYKGFRKGVSYQIHYGTTIDLSEKKIVRSSQVHTSFLKLVNTFGLSHNAKIIYKLLQSYDLHVSGQANLTTLRWQQSKSPATEVVISHEQNKDLIFQGELLATAKINNGKIYKLYQILEDCPFNYVVSEMIDAEKNIAISYKLSKDIETAQKHYGESVGELLKL